MKIIEDTQNVSPAEIIKKGLTNPPKKSGVLVDKNQIPSRGIFYPDDIYITPFTGMDLKDITSFEESTINQTLFKILARRVTGISTNDILIGDKLWFIYKIRDITYPNNKIPIKCTCEHCGTQSIQYYTFDTLKIDYYDNRLPDGQIKLPNTDMIEFAFPTIGTESQVTRLKNDPNLLEPVDDQFMLLASYIKTVNGKKQTIWDAYNYAKNADATTFCKIVRILDKYAFAFPRVAEFNCCCGEKIQAPVQLTQDFFIPDLGDED